MRVPTELYRPRLSLLTDLYQVTMAYVYWKAGRHHTDAEFELSFRANPFEGGFTVAAGLAYALDFLRDFRLSGEELDYLASLKGNDGGPLLEQAFLDYLGRMQLSLDVDAAPEGTVVFPQEPILKVRGPIIQAQLVETPLLNLVNFQTLIATKAARVCLAAKGDPVVEFGLRRAQGIDGSLAASRAAYLGGCAATSNVLAGRIFGIPVVGTHAHSLVMAYEREEDSFLAYADALPNNCIFLVDTYDTLEGVRRAARIGHRLRERGHELVGVRLDSGDLAYLSAQARKILDDAGFPRAKILASNDLDEHIIASLKEQGAAIDSWGVGTKLVTAFDQPALGAVYKLSAVRDSGAGWRYTVKLSEQAIKISTPGLLQVRRYSGPDGTFLADLVYDEQLGCPSPVTMIDPLDITRRKVLGDGAFESVLAPAMRKGQPLGEPPALGTIRERVKAQIARLHPGLTRFVNPHRYPVGLESALHEKRTQLILQARGLA